MPPLSARTASGASGLRPMFAGAPFRPAAAIAPRSRRSHARSRAWRPSTSSACARRPRARETTRLRRPRAVRSRVTRPPASRSPPTTSPPPSGSAASSGSRTCSRRCSCAAGWATRWRPRRFLAAEEAHPLDAFGGLRDGAGVILGHVARRSRITVHGDYDVDGICSTAILVRALRTLGADVDWYLPSRIDDGYGLAAATVERLAARGTDLLVTVDCAITAVAEVAAAKAAGMDVVVTDHHAPRADGALPDATIVHPRLGGYPCPDLCAAGVAYKLAQRAARGRGRGPGGRRGGPRPRRARDRGRRRLADRREPPARARRPAQARGHPQAGAARADGRRSRRPEPGRRGRDRLPPRAAAQRRRAPLPRRRRARAAADRRPGAGARHRRRARRGQLRAPRRRDAHPLRGRGAAGRAEQRPAPPRTCSPPRAGTRA